MRLGKPAPDQLHFVHGVSSASATCWADPNTSGQIVQRGTNCRCCNVQLEPTALWALDVCALVTRLPPAAHSQASKSLMPSTPIEKHLVPRSKTHGRGVEQTQPVRFETCYIVERSESCESTARKGVEIHCLLHVISSLDCSFRLRPAATIVLRASLAYLLCPRCRAQTSSICR
jgi:hypothetical protein